MTENEKALQKPVPKPGMGFFIMGTKASGFSDTFLKWPGLIGEKNRVKAFTCVPLLGKALYTVRINVPKAIVSYE
jgi:hypothetical protein